MNQFFSSLVGSVVRWALALLAGWLLKRGIQLDAATLAALASAIVALAWSGWEKYSSRIKLLTALSTGKPMSEKILEEHVALDAVPPVSTPKTEIPIAA